MRDKVAEVLEARESPPGSLRGATIVSVLLHAALGLPLFFVVTGEPTSTQRPVRVKLQSVQPAQRAAAPAPAAPIPQLPVPVIPIQQEPLPKLTEIKPEEPPKPKTSEIDKSMFGRSTEKPTTEEKPDKAVPGKPEPEAAQSPPAPVAPTIAVAGGSASVASFDGVEFPFPLYVDRMLSLIARRWFRPGSAPGEPATIHFVIRRDGKVASVEVTTSSGNSNFDRAARRAVMEASPLPPLPFEYLGTDLGVHLQFN